MAIFLQIMALTPGDIVDGRWTYRLDPTCARAPLRVRVFQRDRADGTDAPSSPGLRFGHGRGAARSPDGRSGSRWDSAAFGPGYPIPPQARTQPYYIEGGVAGGGSSGDRHLIVIDRERWLLYETWATRWNSAKGRWEAGSGATFDLSSNARRPDGWTSADAAGLAIFPGLVRHDEVAAAGPITHAFRVTVRATNGFVWPASHQAGSTAGAPPMGSRLRLKSSVDISGDPPDVRKIFQAMKTYGLIVADNGTDMYVTGTMDPAWDNDVLNPAFHSLTADDFEVVRLGWGHP